MFEGLFRERGGVDATVDDPRAALLGDATDLVARRALSFEWYSPQCLLMIQRLSAPGNSLSANGDPTHWHQEWFKYKSLIHGGPRWSYAIGAPATETGESTPPANDERLSHFVLTSLFTGRVPYAVDGLFASVFALPAALCMAPFTWSTFPWVSSFLFPVTRPAASLVS
jgi:hypothetical protein